MRALGFVAVALSIAGTASAVDESALRQHFEGMTVVVKMDMPGSSSGVNVHPGASQPVDFRKVASDIKQYGTGVHAGESITVTKVHIKGHHIEFQLGGGGFGSFADYMATSNTTAAAPYYEGKSHREKSLEHDLKYETDPYERRRMKDELDDLRHERKRDNAWEINQAAQANAESKQEERRLRAEDGSRFNIRYDGAFPSGALTPGGVVAALGKFVGFPGASGRAASAAEAPASGASPTALKKGLTLQQVERLLGPAAEAKTETQGGLEIMTRTYSADEQKIVAKFASGVLVEYTITSN